MATFRDLVKGHKLLNQYEDWLEVFIHPKYVNITDVLHDKVERGMQITSNDITMAKYSGALQFLGLCLIETEDRLTIINAMTKLVSNIKSDDRFNKFLDENNTLLERSESK